MIIGVCGFCSSGSSAVSDYLSEFDENQVLDMCEFTIPYLPDGLEDLKYHVVDSITRDESGYIAIERFKRFMHDNYAKGALAKLSNLSDTDIDRITNDFINEITQLEWITTTRSDKLLHPGFFYRYFVLSILKQRIISRLNIKFKRGLPLYPNHPVQVSINPSNFMDESKKFITRILKGMGADFSKNIILDQPFIGDDPAKSFCFFENPKAIVVDRDPRDIYLFGKTVLYKRGRLMPTDNVQDFVKYFKLIREDRPYKKENQNILNIRFEDLVYNYDVTTSKIRSFVGLPDNKRQFSIFDPAISMPNTQVFRKFPEYKQDIQYIERELKDYLFDFSSYPEPSVEGQMFFGKSPLNKK